jgi:hypothetical protein
MSVSAVPSQAVAAQAGWLRSPGFDLHLIATTSIVALASGAAALVRPDLFQVILILDLWLLGYHHVISTFTRLCFDRDSFREHRFLVVELPIIVIAATAAAVMLLGAWVLPTTYLYWQWFHYTRQSYGVERMYRRKAPAGASINDYLTTRALYLVPLFGILYRSWQQPQTFLGMEVKYLPVSDIGLWIVGILAGSALLAWLGTTLMALARGELAFAHFLYVLSHHAIFITGYCLISDITTGWLVLNVWHNIQYIMFVWQFNNKRFGDQVDPQHVFLSTLSQRKHVLGYLGVCIAIATLIYGVLIVSGSYALQDAVSLALVASMVLNFHHYVVDGIIWKRRKAAAAFQAAAGP